MFIKKLLLKNVNSLKGEFVIDFESEAFASNPIFAITGDIGAGKSTILDAICLALYQETPRVSSTSKVELNLGQLATIGATDSYAKVVFENKGKTYRSSWMAGVITRGDNANTWNDPTVDLEELTNGVFESLPDASKKREHKNKVEAIIGLSFDQFSKTILLAQGSFSELLQAKEEERTKIIEKLTGTEEYRLVGQKIFNASNLKKSEIEKKKTFLEGQSEGQLSEEAFNTLCQEKERLDKEIKRISEQFKALQKHVDCLNQFQLLKKDELSTQEKIDATLLQEKAIQEAQEKLKKHRIAQSIHPAFSEYTSVKEDIEKAKRELQNNQDLESKSKNTISEFQTSQKVVFPNLKLDITPQEFIHQVESFLSQTLQKEKQLAELDSALEKENIQLENATKNLQLEQDRKSKIEKEKVEQIKKIESSKAFFANNTLSTETAENILDELEEFNTTIKSWRDKTAGIISIPNLEDCDSALSTWMNEAQEKSIAIDLIDFNTAFHTVYSDLHKTLDSSKKELSDIQHSWKIEEQILDSILVHNKEKSTLEKSIVSLEKSGQDWTETINTLKTRIAELEKTIEHSKKKFTSLYLSDGNEVETLRGALIDNEPCMVCGSTTHPFTEENNDTLKAFAKQKLNEVEWENQHKSLKSELEKAINSLTKNEGELKAKKELLARCNVSIQTETEKLCFLDQHQLDKQEFDQKLNTAAEFCSKKVELAQSNLQAFLLQLQISAATAMQKINHRRDELNKELKAKTQNTEAKKTALKDYITAVNTEAAISLSAEKRIQELNQSISEIENILKVSKQHNEKQQETIKALQQSKVELLKNIKLIFNYAGNSAQYKDHKLREHSALVQDLVVIVDRIKTNIKSITNLEQLGINKQKAFESALKEKNFKDEKDMKESLLADSDYSDLEQQCRTYNDTLLALKTRLEKVISDLNTLGKVEPEELQKLPQHNQNLTELETALTNNNQEFGALNEQITNHKLREQSLGKAQNELNELNEKYKPFYLLNKAIGDKQGKRFANVAARYTFNKLLEFTNFHLQSLKSRYTFAFLETLSQKEQDLMIIDSQMGNSIRPAKSTLSGGETFLTSLCLALALSDLSSNKVQIKSLFIDEGFGSLDQDSLHEAISLLENLPDATGKTIGIISHVEALKQRIPTQIELKKQGNGYSKMKLPN